MNIKNTFSIFRLMLLSYLSTQQSQAAVHVLEGSYLSQSDDIHIQRDRRDFRLRRVYSSRLLHRGLFGFGWCTTIEKRLKIRSPDKAELQDCQRTSPQSYTIEWTAGEKTYSLTTKEPDDQVLKFNERGQLVEMLPANGLSVSISYNSEDRPSDLVIGGRHQLHINYNVDNNIQDIEDSTGQKILAYSYKNGLLVAVENVTSPVRWVARASHQKLNQYIYDEYNNLIWFRDGLKNRYEMIRYDKDLDRVTQVSTSDGCRTQVEYIAQNLKQIWTTKLRKSCHGTLIRSEEYQFAFAQNLNGSMTLKKITRQENPSRTQKFMDKTKLSRTKTEVVYEY